MTWIKPLRRNPRLIGLAEAARALPAGTLEAAMRGHVIAEAALVGTYHKKR